MLEGRQREDWERRMDLSVVREKTYLNCQTKI